MIEDLKQNELDLFEKAALKDLFGSEEPGKIILEHGLFKFDITDKIQNIIFKFEEKVRPFLDEQGLLNGRKLKNTLPVSYAKWIPEEQIRLMEIYPVIRPLLLSLKGIVP